ncbi:MAG: MFS transporter [Pusillimonas sp.]|nr:MFS transporter [Pusillimonas sp.]
MPFDDTSFSLKKISVAAFGPSLLFGIGEGAIYPVIALSARDLGASVALSGIIVALIGMGSLLNNIPAAILTARFGERRAMVGAAIVAIIALIICLLAPNPFTLGVGILLVGMTRAVFLLARQTYLTEAVPIDMRARALSTLGGVTRIGMFIGPFAGAGVMHFMGLSGAYIVATITFVFMALLAFTIPDLPQHIEHKSTDPDPKISGLRQVAHAHFKTYLTLGVGCLLVAAVRSSRQVIIPLWAAHIGIDAATTSVVYGLMGAIDMLLFYPAGKLMDHKGRAAVAIPSMVIMALCIALMPLTASLWTFVLVTMILGFGNGISSGLVMTVGADASPRSGRTQFLGIWRFMGDIGNSGGPLLLSAITAMISLAGGMFAIGGLALISAGIFWRWLPAQVRQNNTQ